MFFFYFFIFFNSLNFYLHALIFSTHFFLSIKYLHIIPVVLIQEKKEKKDIKIYPFSEMKYPLSDIRLCVEVVYC